MVSGVGPRNRVLGRRYPANTVEPLCMVAMSGLPPTMVTLTVSKLFGLSCFIIRAINLSILLIYNRIITGFFFCHSAFISRWSRSPQKAYMHQSGVSMFVCLSVCLSVSCLPLPRKAIRARLIRTIHRYIQINKMIYVMNVNIITA